MEGKLNKIRLDKVNRLFDQAYFFAKVLILKTEMFDQSLWKKISAHGE